MENRINIFFRPIGNQDTASSRLRVWNIQPHIENSVVGVADEYRKGDVLIIQKIPDINELRKAKSQGAKVIYDIDDCYWKENHVYENWKDFLQMIKEADLVTVDTEEKKKLITEKEAVVIPDSLDWDGTETKGGQKGIIGWTGYGNNAQYLNEIIDKIPKEFNVRLIADTSWVQYIKAPALNIQNRPWSLEMVDKYLAECEFGIYYLPEREFEFCKGTHKLLKNLAIGLPTYTSCVPDYVKTFNESGLGDKFIVKDWSKLKNIATEDDIKNGREYAMKFTAEKVAKMWEKIIK